ncbi:MAG: hypothetical protein LBK77_05075 [Spirochaetaceae bacterium]|nr:hypothetical protein [Spirochaetaceae bacterium]
MIRNLTEAECKRAMEQGEFDGSLIRGSAALILTQSWCPQWKAMKSYLEEAESRFPGLDILYVEYDTAPWHEAFMGFKERRFANREIPYVRYYRDGTCTGQSNYVTLEGFLHRLGLE